MLDRGLRLGRTNILSALRSQILHLRRPLIHRGNLSLGRAFWVSLLLLLAGIGSFARADFDEAAFRADLKALTAAPTRVVGSAGYFAAADYIEQQVSAMPSVQWQRHEYDMMVPVTQSARLTWAGGSTDVYPFWPASVRLNATSKEGIIGQVVYMGTGGLEEIRPAAAQDQIVAVEGRTGLAWQQAAYFGAKAILVLGSETLNNVELRSHDLNLPVDIPRFFVPEGALADQIRSGKLPGPATLTAEVNWQRTRSRNYYALVKPAQIRPQGWTAQQNPGALVLSVPYDSMALVPDLAKGAGQAVQTAAGLALLRDLAQHPLDRPVLIFFGGGDGIQFQATRQMFMAFADVPSNWRAALEQLTTDQATVERQLARLAEIGDQPGKLRVTADRLLIARLSKLIETDASLEQDELFRLRTARKQPPDVLERLKALEERQVRLSQIRFTFQQRPQEFVGADLTLANAYLHRLAVRLGGDEAKHTPGLKQQFAERRAELERRVALYQWLAGQIQKPADSKDRSNSVRLIEMMIALDFSDAGRKAGPMFWGWFARQSSISQIQDYRDWFSRQERAASETKTGAQADWFRSMQVGVDLEPFAGTREPQSWLCASMAIGTELAQAWGVPGFSIITLDDLRLRRDTPNDTLDRLNVDRIIPQVIATRSLLFRAWNDPSFRGPPELKWLRAGFEGQVVSAAPGQPVPDLPRDGFLASYFSVSNTSAKIPRLSGVPYSMGIRRNEVQPCDAEGRYYFQSLPKLGSDQAFSVQTYRIEPNTGRITASTDLGKQAGDIKNYADIRQDLEPLRSIVFDCDQITLSGLYDPRYLQDLGEVLPLDARRNAEPQRYNLMVKSQMMTMFVEPASSSYLVFRYGRIGNRLLLINMPDARDVKVESSTAGGKVEAGRGFSVSHLNNLGPLSLVTARDFWQLDTVRLEKYRRAGVTSSLVDSMHEQAAKQLTEARQTLAANDAAGFIKNANGAWANEARVYSAAQDMAGDVIRAAIFLLLLCVPFSFCMERLLIGSPSVYKQITGLCVIFAIMTAALWSFHPAFKISSSPLIIILAFAIIFMSVVVISVVYGKFDTELKRIRSGRGSAEGVTFASAGVLMSAVLLGIANMRKRKFRTTLTSITIVLITFAVLCFTSASRYLDVATLPTGVPSDHPGIMLRQRGFRPMPAKVLQNLHAVMGAQPVVERWWNVNAGNPRDMYHVRTDQKLFAAQAVLGLSPGESTLSPAIAEVIGPEKFARLEKGEGRIIYMSRLVAAQLEVKEGQKVRMGGIDLEVAGIFDADDFDRKVTMLSGDPLAPLKYTSGSLDAGGRRLDDNALESLDLDADSSSSELQSNYEHLSATQFVIVPSAVSMMLPGSSLRSVAMRFADESAMKKAAEELSRRFAVAMFAGYDDGVRMVVASNLASVSGAGQVAIPLAIAGLIIFNTMMGSIAERKREIHVYTSLGLAPLHVGALFVAEAMTYGLIGTVFGYVIGQGVGTLFLKLGWLGNVTLNYSGSSAMLTMGLILLIVLMSALVPARLASRLAAPSIDRTWKVPLPRQDEILAVLPFTINRTAAEGALGYLNDFFSAHQEGSIGKFSAGKVEAFAFEDEQKGMSRGLKTIIWLTPFDLGVRQHLMLLVHPGEFPDIYEVQVVLSRLSGDDGSWYRMNRTFLTELRKQFLQWRSLSPQRMLQYVEESRKLFVTPEATAAGAVGRDVPGLA